MQAELLEQSSLIADLASKLEIITRDVTGLGRYTAGSLSNNFVAKTVWSAWFGFGFAGLTTQVILITAQAFG